MFIINDLTTFLKRYFQHRLKVKINVISMAVIINHKRYTKLETNVLIKFFFNVTLTFNNKVIVMFIINDLTTFTKHYF